MNLVNKEVTHKVFGEGSIIDHTDSVLTIEFKDGIKKFVYPDALGTFITLHDRDVAKSLKKLISEKEKEEKALEQKREEERERQMLEQKRKEKLKNAKIHESSQIVFWLDEEEIEEVFHEWNVFTGTIQSGKNKGKPSRAARLRPNSACVVTTRTADEKEENRRILGLFMVTETFSGEQCEDGIIPAHETYRIKLTDEEAEKMLFWNYYMNKSHPHRTTWNSGKFRYFDNEWTAQMLKDIIALLTDEQRKKEATDFLAYFCEMNALDIDNIPEPSGALKQ